MINPHIKFDVFKFTHYEDKKSKENVKKLGWFGRLGVTQGHQQYYHLIDRI